jgi:Tol biopolymer transport system component
VGGAGKLTVIDAAGSVLAAPKTVNIIAHFWSPVGDKIAFITLNRDVPGLQTRYRPNGSTASAGLQAPTLTWFLLDVTTGATTTLADFFPTRDMIYYLNFADQFSRSHSLWSADGRYLTYGSASDGVDRVLLLDVSANRAGATINVAEGALGVWSWR